LKEEEDSSSSSSSCRHRRFLQRSKATDRWYEISEDKAKEMIRKALYTATNSSTNRCHLTDDIAFPFKLHSILEYAEKTNRVDIISWLPSGDAFKIHKPHDFADTILPQYFNQTKYRSFQRQLNIYGFDRVTDKASAPRPTRPEPTSPSPPHDNRNHNGIHQTKETGRNNNRDN